MNPLESYIEAVLSAIGEEVGTVITVESALLAVSTDTVESYVNTRGKTSYLWSKQIIGLNEESNFKMDEKTYKEVAIENTTKLKERNKNLEKSEKLSPKDFLSFDCKRRPKGSKGLTLMRRKDGAIISGYDMLWYRNSKEDDWVSWKSLQTKGKKKKKKSKKNGKSKQGK